MTRRGFLVNAGLVGAVASVGSSGTAYAAPTPAPSIPRAKLLIRNVSVLTLDNNGTVLPTADIAIDGGRIMTVGRAPGGFVPATTIDGTNKLAVPGFFNAHTHSPMTLFRGIAEDLTPERWFFDRILPLESILTDEDVYWGAALAALEMIRSGTVGFNDHYFYMDRVAEVVEQSGMKATLAWAVFGIPELDRTIDLAGSLAFIDRWQGKAEGRIRTVLGPHSPYLCPPDFLRQVATEARNRMLGIHLHVAETAAQVTDSQTRFGLTPVAHLQSLGILDVPTVAAHSIHLTPADVAILAQRRASAVHTPFSYMKLGLEIKDRKPLVDARVNLALGVDGAASNNDMDMKDVVRVTPLIQKLITQNATAFPGDLPLRLATANGALAMGFPNSGVLANNRAADLVLFDMDQPHLCPRHNLVANLVHAGGPGDVTHVICDGRVLYANGEFLTLDEEKIKAEASARAKALADRLPPTFPGKGRIRVPFSVPRAEISVAG